MRALNRRLEVDGVPVAIIAADALRALGLTRGAAPAMADRGRRRTPPAREGREPLGRVSAGRSEVRWPP